MFAHMLARLTVLCGLLIVANGCCHCGHCKPGIVDCLIGGSCCDSGCGSCTSGCGGCTSSCGGCNDGCGHGCGLGSHIRNKMVCAPQFGGEVYQGCSCGELYHGDWKSHPPCPDPCDCYGNHTGCANCCQSCNHLNKGRFCGLKGFFSSLCHECNDCNSCGSCGGGCASGGCASGGCTSCGH